MKNFKKICVAIFILALGISSCKKFLDINSDPASPQKPTIAALFPPLTGCMSRTMALDGRFSGAYIQNFSNTTLNDFIDQHGGNAPNGGGNQAWRDFFTVQGTAINTIIEQGIKDAQWDYVGAAFAVRAWGLQNATDIFSDLPYTQAWEKDRIFFKYDNQPKLYKTVDSLCRVALDYLSRSDGGVNNAVMARGDLVYRGVKANWIKFVYGLLARNWHHQSNKSDYNPDSVINYVNRSMINNADNFNIAHGGTRNDDTNPWGPARDNLGIRRQSRFIVQLLDGTSFYNNTLPSSRDPRLARMLSVSPDTSTINANLVSLNGGYRFLIPSAGFLVGTIGNAFRQAPSTLWGDSVILNPGASNFNLNVGKYLFRNNAPFPIMTFFELQFIKAEAAFRKGDLSTALAAYQAGIGGHLDYINTTNPTQPITLAERTAYLTSPAVKQTAASLTLTDIMLQKYIGDFAWNFNESWCDMRRYHYFDIDPITNAPVYRNFSIPTYSALNFGPRPAYRSRPTGFSENDWNFNELIRIGALNQDYHTYEMWFSQP